MFADFQAILPGYIAAPKGLLQLLGIGMSLNDGYDNECPGGFNVSISLYPVSILRMRRVLA